MSNRCPTVVRKPTYVTKSAMYKSLCAVLCMAVGAAWTIVETHKADAARQQKVHKEAEDTKLAQILDRIDELHTDVRELRSVIMQRLKGSDTEP